MADLIAVLTGDLVKSRDLSPKELDLARAAVQEAAAQMTWAPKLVLGKPEFFRGDAWQMALADPTWALRAALLVRASVKGLGVTDTRIAIGIGGYERIDRARISRSTGEAFELSGRVLDGMAKWGRMDLAATEGSGCLARWGPVVVRLVDALADEWKPRQAEVARVALAEPGIVQAEIGERLDPPISQQAVRKALSGIRWHTLGEALADVETINNLKRL